MLCKSVHKWQFTGTVHIRTKTLRSQRYHYRHCMYGQITIQTQYITFKDKTKVPCQGAQKGVFGQHYMYWYVLPLAPHPSPSDTASMSACLPVGQVFVVVKQLNFHNLIFINRSCHRPLEGLEKNTTKWIGSTHASLLFFLHLPNHIPAIWINQSLEINMQFYHVCI